MYFEDLALHMTKHVGPVVIEKEKLMAFAREYDPIPMHTDEEYAKTTPFHGLIAPGVMSFMSVWAKYLEDDFAGREVLAGKSTKIQWLKPVYAGDVLTASVEITKLTRRSEKNGVMEVTLTAQNQHGIPVLTNVTEIVVKCRPNE